MADTALDTGLFRRVMGRFATGVTVITAEAEGGVRGMTANAFMSGSLSPPLCIISVATKAKLHNALTAGRTFGVSMLAQGQEAISRHFAGQAPADPEILFEHMHLRGDRDAVSLARHLAAAVLVAASGPRRRRRSRR